MSDTTTTVAPAAAGEATTTAPPSAGATTSTSPALSRVEAAMQALAGGGAPEPAPVLPSTPEAPATAAVLEAEEVRSKAIRERRAQDDARRTLEAERAAWQAEQKARLDRAEEIERRMAAFERDPAAYIKAREGGRSPDEIARELWIETVDLKTLPPEQATAVKWERQLRATNRENERIRAELEQERAERQKRDTAATHERLLADYTGSLRSHLSQLQESTTPFLREIAQANASTALDMLLSYANARAAQNPHAPVLQAPALALELEASIKANQDLVEGVYKRRFAAPVAAAAAARASTAAPAVTPAAARATISSALTDETPVTRGARTREDRIAAAERALGGR